MAVAVRAGRDKPVKEKEEQERHRETMVLRKSRTPQQLQSSAVDKVIGA